MYFATNMCKNGLFLAHKSVRNEVLAFLVHFPKVLNLVEKIVLFLIKPGMDHFSTGTGEVPASTKTWFLQLISLKICYF